MQLHYQTVKEQLAHFLKEDIGSGDLTAELTAGHTVSGSFLVKDDGVLAGIDIPQYCYQVLGGDRGTIDYKPLAHDGEQVSRGTVVATVRGDAAIILAAERVSLNLMQRMSGIATATSQAVHALDDSTIKILDTRKTVPGLRLFDKYSVRCGGGYNHRMGLYDLAMLKDNHLTIAGTQLSDAVALLRSMNGPTKLVEVEVENETELHAAIDADVDIIMFDNQSVETAKRWRALVPEHIKTEVSGGMTLEKLPAYHGSGVDFISLGYLTNSVKNVDISFNLDMH